MHGKAGRNPVMEQQELCMGRVEGTLCWSGRSYAWEDWNAPCTGTAGAMHGNGGGHPVLKQEELCMGRVECTLYWRAGSPRWGCGDAQERLPLCRCAVLPKITGSFWTQDQKSRAQQRESFSSFFFSFTFIKAGRKHEGIVLTSFFRGKPTLGDWPLHSVWSRPPASWRATRL